MEIFVFFEMGKKQGNKKRVVYLRRGSGIPSGAPPSREHTHSYKNLPYNQTLIV
jgi:hypothetical protein